MTGMDDRLDEAGDWLVRLQSDALSEEDALAFDAWLAASPENGRAYDAVVAASHEIDANRMALRLALSAQRTRNPIVSRRRLFWGGGLAAAAIAASAAIVVLPAGVQTYATAPGERQRIQLADGSSLELNGATRLSARMTGKMRRIELEVGEASFDVAHDANRPFLVDTGDSAVRVVGTQFNVRRRGGRVAVAVARGEVEVGPDGGGLRQHYRLRPGQRLDHAEGATDARITSDAAQAAFGWRAGRLIYRNATLGEVVEDLNAQFARPMRVADPRLAAVRVSGVLVLDDQQAVIRRLALLTPIEAKEESSGVLLQRAP
ncbi:iron dicitrate transport regulator FecR [Caulobacter mirabilis]|uniref:Iron dicitrate transport regulator FecR n=2 Tax=Caulobacter mirabilis TaxID=69666 RepID=A0A2D2B2Y8_9CAUL|nr:iron dicitrate transport regulator FecR [Caulobacter mirabilis]